MSEPPTDRPLRADAARSRVRILDAAADLFAQHGLGATLNEIAHHAGVGVGTVYRHFPDKDELVETLLQERIEEMVAVGEAGLADPDPWHGLVVSLERSIALQASNRGLKQLLQDPSVALERAVRVRARILPIGMELLRRAQDAGAVREDVDPDDLPLIQLMVGAVVDAARDVNPELWRRYLALLLRGIAAHPETLPELSGNALAPDEVDVVMTAAKAPSTGSAHPARPV